jgi:MinD-like ATPase involved in chromosome partitioning or flagellar assembly
MSDRAGKIITFYSYKGGTGRTMAVSNVAWVLASNGHKVLLIDWDLEAPGLHRYLRPFLIDQELASTPGLIDFVWDATRISMTPAEHEPKFPSLNDYVVGLDWSFAGDGVIDFIPAGRQDENYAQRVNTFNWDNFYERLGGGKLLEAQREALRANYDYILIDSRTGVSDTSSICTVHMPDSLVILFTLNRQSITGAAAIAESVQKQRGEEDFKIFPVPTRVENAEDVKFAAATAYARRIFKSFLRHVQSKSDKIDPDQQLPYWNDVETPYVQFYAFEEIPAAFKDEPGSRKSVLRASERLAYWITDQTVASLQPDSDERRTQVVDAYAFSEDDAPSIEWAPPPSQGRFRNFQRRLKKSGWRYATIVLAGLVILAGGLTGYKYNATLTKLDATVAEKAAVETKLNTALGQKKDVEDKLGEKTTELNRKVEQLNSDENAITSFKKTIRNQALQIRRLLGHRQ